VSEQYIDLIMHSATIKNSFTVFKVQYQILAFAYYKRRDKTPLLWVNFQISVFIGLEMTMQSTQGYPYH